MNKPERINSSSRSDDLGSEASGETSPTKRAIRVITALDGLTPAEAKSRFAWNLDKLLRIIGLSRKDAAEAIGISYPLIRRLATAGVSRFDDLNAVSIGKIVHFFGLGSTFDLWNEELGYVLTPERSLFTAKFRDRLMAEQRLRQSLSDEESREELGLINQALGADPVARLPKEIEQKIAAILESPKKRQFRALIDDYYDFVTSGDARRVV